MLRTSQDLVKKISAIVVVKKEVWFKEDLDRLPEMEGMRIGCLKSLPSFYSVFEDPLVPL